jgi:hypothetical protein
MGRDFVWFMGNLEQRRATNSPFCGDSFKGGIKTRTPCTCRAFGE